MARASEGAIVETIMQLARGASIEMNVQDTQFLDASCAFLPAGKKIYISHLPKQTWTDTLKACCAAREVGFDPVPHLPVRLMPEEGTLDRVLDDLVSRASVQEVLLIAGDYPRALGPYSNVTQALRSGMLHKHGLKRVSVAGHPEGHPQVALEEIRRAEREKALLAGEDGLDMTFVTQFFFEHRPFLDWVRELRSHGIRARTVAGLAGPAGLATLFKFAIRCGAGASIRALGARPTSLANLMGHHGPEHVVRGLAEARSAGESQFDGMHMFCFGGFLHTCEWLDAVANGRFKLGDKGQLRV